MHGIRGPAALLRGFAVGTVGYFFGLGAVGATDMPAGPTIVCSPAIATALGRWGVKSPGASPRGT